MFPRLAFKGPGIGTTFTTLACVPFAVNYIKAKDRLPKQLLPALKAVSLLAGDERCARAAGKAGAVDVALGLFVSSSGQIRYHATLRHTLKLLGNLMCAPLNVTRFVNRQGPAKILSALMEWPKIDTRNRHRDIRKAMVVVFSRMVATPAGQAAFVGANGVSVVFALVKQMQSDSNAGNAIFLQSCMLLLRKCRPSKPLPSQTAVLTFPLPACPYKVRVASSTFRNYKEITRKRGFFLSLPSLSHLPFTPSPLPFYPLSFFLVFLRTYGCLLAVLLLTCASW